MAKKHVPRGFHEIEPAPAKADLPDRYPKGRRCKCGTELNTYNPHTRCYVCQAKYEKQMSHSRFLGSGRLR